MIVRKRLKSGWLVPLTLSALLTACASTPDSGPDRNDAEREWVIAGAGELPTGVQASIDTASLLAVNDDMRRFVRRVTADAVSRADKINALSHALLDRDKLGMSYDAEANLTAAEAFAERRANCISYTLLVIALAREIGIAARFNYVQIPPTWDLRGDQLMIYQHINARIDEPPPRGVYSWSSYSYSSATIVDVASADYSPHYPQWAIKDSEAQAHFYSNLAADAATTNPRQALRYQLEALRLAPDQSFLWANLAQRYLSLGNPKAAEVAIRTSLRLDPDGLIAYALAARIYRRLGDGTRALELQRQEQALLARNPYHYYWLAQRAFRLSQLSDANQATQRAIELDPTEHRFYFLQGIILRRLDKPQEAQRSFETALRLSADDTDQQARYRSKFARLKEWQAATTIPTQPQGEPPQ